MRGLGVLLAVLVAGCTSVERAPSPAGPGLDLVDLWSVTS